MSDTPETDNFIVSAGYVRTDHQWRTFSRKLKRERDEARKQLRVAVGLLSTTPRFQDKHPEEVLKFVEEAAK